jgi:hypothetical protein
MSDKEIIIRLKLPKRPQTRTLVIVALVLLGVAGTVYAMLPQFMPLEGLSAKKLNDNFANLDGRVTTLETRWFVDALITGAMPDISTATSSSFRELSVAGLSLSATAASVPVLISCSGSQDNTGGGCTTPEYGITFTPSTTGYMKACATFSVDMDVASAGSAGYTFATWKLVQTANASQIVANDGNEVVLEENDVLSTGRLALVHGNKVCGIFPSSGGVRTTIRLFYTNATSGIVNGHVLETSAANGNSMHWDVVPL